MLTVDIGNSRIKWGVWRAGVLSAQDAHDYKPASLATVLDAAWATLDAPQAVMLGCVAGNDVAQAVQTWLRQHWQLEAQELRSTQQFADLRHSYAQPEQHGVDRWAALIAARSLYQTPLCVISCGTATTLDLIAASGQHLGGQIMPGTELMLSAVQMRVPALANLRLPTTLPAAAFASESAAALLLGVVHMAAAGLDRACDSAREQLGEQMKTLITGGAAPAMLALMKNPLELQPNLVLQGLYIAGQQVQS